MTTLGIRKTHGGHPAPIRVSMPANIKYTILPSADGVLDPEMVREIVEARNARAHMVARQVKKRTLGGSKK